jgi:hypothetical protein
MRNAIVFILVALFACGGLMLVGCKKKEEPAPTAETGTLEPTAEPIPEPTAETGGTAATGEEMPTAEGAPGEGGK